MSPRLRPLAFLLVAAAVAPGAPAAGQRVEAGAVAIPEGSYIPLYAAAGNGSTAEGAPRTRVAAFTLDVHPVTVSQFARFLAEEPRWRRSRANSLFAGDDYLASWPDDLTPPDGHPDRPITEVAWFIARAYCAWSGGRLPTTDEWEYAAGANATRTDAFRDRDFNALVLALYQARSARAGRLPAVGATDRNAFGVEDLHGLVWEWTEDFNNQVLTGSGRDDTALDRQLFCAAGSSGATDLTDYGGFLRHAHRASLDGTSSGPGLGFRCAR
jgi:formylglycine-generating enzyme required for sulfatase activity